ncbi:MAG: hypothetical protein ACK56I_16075, partial [bacterium]
MRPGAHDGAQGISGTRDVDGQTRVRVGPRGDREIETEVGGPLESGGLAAAGGAKPCGRPGVEATQVGRLDQHRAGQGSRARRQARGHEQAAAEPLQG